MKSRIKNIDELLAMEPGTTIYIVEDRQIESYKVCGPYPSTFLKSVFVTRGTNNGLSKWINQHVVEYGKIYTEHKDAVDVFLRSLANDYDVSVRIYMTKELENDGQGFIRPEWIGRNNPPDDGRSVIWAHFPIHDDSMLYGTIEDMNEYEDQFEGLAINWFTHWRPINNEFFYLKK